MQALLPPPIQQKFTTPLNPNQQQQVSINANQQPQNQAAHNPLRPTTIPAQPVPNPNNLTHPPCARIQKFKPFPPMKFNYDQGKL
jgi:hypothetical protein